MTTPAPMPRRAELVDGTAFDGGLLLHDAVRHQVHVLNAASALVWQACDGQTPRLVVADAFADALGHPVAQVARDIDGHLRELAALQLLDRPAPPPERARPAEVLLEAHVSRPIQVLDRQLTVRTTSTAAVRAVEDLFADVLAEDLVPAPAAEVPGLGLEGVDGGWRVHGRGHDRTLPTWADALEVLVSQVNRVAGEARVLALHAAGVRTPDGKVLLLAGASGAGKSTLTAALVQRGWDYLGDEAIGITPDGRALGYPKPLSLDDRSRGLLGLRAPVGAGGLVPPAALGGAGAVVAGDAGPVACTVLLDADHGAPRSSAVERCTPQEAVVRVAPQAVNLAASGAVGLAALAHLAQAVPVHRLGRLPVEQAAAALAELADRPT